MHAVAVPFAYVPAAQSEHATLPVSGLYVPAMHELQTPPSGPLKPALHVQPATAEVESSELELIVHTIQVSADVAVAVDEYVPAPQLVHTPLPVSILYFPETHAVHHVSPLGPVYPALHVHMLDA